MSGKNYRKAAEALKGKGPFSVEEGVKMLKETSSTKFDSTAEVHFCLTLDPKQADQQLRGTIVLPHGSGKKSRIAVLTREDKVKDAKDAGADAAGLEELVEEFAKGKIDYDVILATPDVMKDLGKVAKTLGQKGMMPNPKSGTVVSDVKQAVSEFKRGKVEYRNDKEGNVHLIFGKTSFKADELENNLKAILQVIRDAKPASIKGLYVKSITLCSTMGPGIRLDVNQTLASLAK